MDDLPPRRHVWGETQSQQVLVVAVGKAIRERVLVPDYSLAPSAMLEEMVRQIGPAWHGCTGTGHHMGWTRSAAMAIRPQLGQVGSARAALELSRNAASGFGDQSRAFHTHWSARSPSELHVIEDRNHFDVFLDLADRTTLLARELVALAHGRS